MVLMLLMLLIEEMAKRKMWEPLDRGKAIDDGSRLGSWLDCYI